MFAGKAFDFFFDGVSEKVFGDADAFDWTGDLDALDSLKAAAKWRKVSHLNTEAGACVDFEQCWADGFVEADVGGHVAEVCDELDAGGDFKDLVPVWDFHAADFAKAFGEFFDNFVVMDDVGSSAFSYVDANACGAHVEVGFAFGFARWEAEHSHDWDEIVYDNANVRKAGKGILTDAFIGND